MGAPPEYLPGDTRDSIAEKLEKAWEGDHEGKAWRDAVEKGEFRVDYQPQYDADSGSVIGVACRYTTFGFSAKTAAATRAAADDPVSAPAIQAIAVVASAKERTEIRTADAPVR